MRKLAVVTFFVLCLSGCDDFHDGPYQVTWHDEQRQRMLYYYHESGIGVGMVGPTVIAIGSDAHYVVVARMPLQDVIRDENAFLRRRDPATDWQGIAYYIIDRTKDHRLADEPGCVCKLGPLTEVAYKREATRLKLPALRNLD